MLLTYREWLLERLSQEQPPSAGDLDDNQSNADRSFGSTGARSKNFGPSVKPEKLTTRSPEKMYGKKDKS